MTLIEHCRDRWPKDGDRERRWAAHFLGPQGSDGTRVLLRRYAVLAKGEHLDDYPPTVELSWAEWAEGHGEYGLGLDGEAA